VKNAVDANRSKPVPAETPSANVSFPGRVRAALFGEPGTFDGAPFTRAIIWANVIVFVAQLVVARDPIALMIMPADVVLAFGANESALTIGDGQVATMLTSCFLHASILHIGFNMVALRSVGPFVERAVGTARFAPMYVASGIAGSALSAITGWIRLRPSVSVGASGAICGVIGAAMIIGARTQGWRGPLTQAMGRWLATIFILGALPQVKIDNAAHAGGAIAGALVASLWRRGVRHEKLAEQISAGACAALCVLAAIVVGLSHARDPDYRTTAERWYARATHALAMKDCRGAVRGLFVVGTVAPEALETRSLAVQVNRHCPRELAQTGVELRDELPPQQR
jgi:rhomboid protease GluP